MDMEKDAGMTWRGKLALTALAAALILGAPTMAARAGKTPDAAREYFEVREIAIDGLTSITQAEALKLLGIRPGSGIFEVDLMEAGRRLETHPLVFSVEIRRKIPSTLYVRVEERRPRFILQAGELRWLMDGSGVVISALDGAAGTGYPVIFIPTLEGERIARGVKLASRELSGVMDVAGRFQGYKLFGKYAFIGAGALGGERAVARFTGTDVTVAAPTGQWTDEMERLAAVDLLLRGEETGSSVIDLSFSGKVVVRRVAAAAENNQG
jgi:cell division protein FtsQ